MLILHHFFCMKTKLQLNETILSIDQKTIHNEKSIENVRGCISFLKSISMTDLFKRVKINNAQKRIERIEIFKKKQSKIN